MQNLFEKLWADYSELNPQAKTIHSLLEQRGEQVVNDHVAFRTFNDPRVGIPKLEQVFLSNGYVRKGEYHFKEKKLFARHYESPRPDAPKVFISELKLEQCSTRLQETVQGLLKEVPATLPDSQDFCVRGRPWRSTYATYQELYKESEYAAWLSAFGFRVNHFTVFFNRLKTFESLAALNAFIKEKGFTLNASGGEIKGTPADFLEQSSTMASQVPVRFEDETVTVPGCYYEFARRYPMPNGVIYQGFVEKSADKIFESTHSQKN